ncbi:unnamed protein product [Cylindrotheca closterium]|uniref:thiopurine S-methyltransferase n=1 Tax=Cylindrotheca closterium TaxID=2856 RepID=A0AAD2JJI8_9STRA|nr:unnamed protein product [Cylindrotheca closterium]
MSDVPAGGAADENTPNLKPWLNRWENRQIGFHMSDVNPILTQFAKDLLQHDLPNEEKEGGGASCSTSRVLVPLCGKTVDMAYLAKISSEVYGIEGIQTALVEFAQEHAHLKIENKGTVDGFERFEGNKITLLKGDYFQLGEVQTKGKFEAIYDRASMVAIEPEMRKDYVQIISNLIAKGGILLLVVLERVGPEEFAKKGPPFSIPESAVQELYGGLEWVESIKKVSEKDSFKDNPAQQQRYAGLDQLLETVYLIRAKK